MTPRMCGLAVVMIAISMSACGGEWPGSGCAHDSSSVSSITVSRPTRVFIVVGCGLEIEVDIPAVPGGAVPMPTKEVVVEYKQQPTVSAGHVSASASSAPQVVSPALAAAVSASLSAAPQSARQPNSGNNRLRAVMRQLQTGQQPTLHRASSQPSMKVLSQANSGVPTLKRQFSDPRDLRKTSR